MGTVICAPNRAAVEGPLIFLAGPIQGAIPWQEVAIRYLRALDDRVHIASPRRRVATQLTDAGYREQVDWETEHLNRAAEDGVILFWLARECEPVAGRDYAQTTRFELGEWKERARRDGIRLVVGIEEVFNGARYVRHRLAQECPQVPIRCTLESTCRAAISLMANDSVFLVAPAAAG